MHQITKLSIYFVMFILITGIVKPDILVTSIVKPENGNYNYNSQESYKDEDFLRNSDASKWDFKKVDWSNPAVFLNPSVYQRPEIYNNVLVYQNPAFYKNLPDDKYEKLDYKQVQFNQIEDHEKIAADKYLKDLGCKKCMLTKERIVCEADSSSCITTSDLPKGTLRFSSEGIHHEGGDYVSIPGTYANNDVLFKVTPDGIIVWPSSRGKITIPDTDTLKLEASKNKVTYGGKDIELNAGYFIFKNGNMYVKKESWGELNGLELHPSTTDIKLFFDGEEHNECKCTYVSMDTDKKTVVSGAAEGRAQHIKFLGTNQFVKIQGPLDIRQSFGTITFQNREDQGLIPEIKMIFGPAERSELTSTTTSTTPNVIKNGDTELQVFDKQNINQVKVVTLDGGDRPIEYKSNPLVLRLEDNNGKSILGTENQPQKMIFGENNEISTLGYETIAAQEPINLYFKSADDVKPELELAAQADKNIKKLQDEVRNKWGNPGMRIFGYLDDPREAPIVRALSNGCGRAGVALAFCTSVVFNEGLNLYIDRSFYENPKSEVSGFVNLGLDNFGSEVEKLKKMGYLRKDFSEYKIPAEEIQNEHGQKVISANFNNIDFAIEAVAARLKWTRDMVSRDAAKYGYELDNDQLDYWTYVYWNCGPGCKTQKLQNGPEIPSNSGRTGQGDPIGNAKRVLATRDLISGVFDRTLSQRIAMK